jgi:hypothetical protein
MHRAQDSRLVLQQNGVFHSFARPNNKAKKCERQTTNTEMKRLDERKEPWLTTGWPRCMRRGRASIPREMNCAVRSLSLPVEHLVSIICVSNDVDAGTTGSTRETTEMQIRRSHTPSPWRERSSSTPQDRVPSRHHQYLSLGLRWKSPCFALDCSGDSCRDPASRRPFGPQSGGQSSSRPRTSRTASKTRSSSTNRAQEARRFCSSHRLAGEGFRRTSPRPPPRAVQRSPPDMPPVRACQNLFRGLRCRGGPGTRHPWKSLENSTLQVAPDSRRGRGWNWGARASARRG